jgi:hypothetical protein
MIQETSFNLNSSMLLYPFFVSCPSLEIFGSDFVFNIHTYIAFLYTAECKFVDYFCGGLQI